MYFLYARSTCAVPIGNRLAHTINVLTELREESVKDFLRSRAVERR